MENILNPSVLITPPSKGNHPKIFLGIISLLILTAFSISGYLVFNKLNTPKVGELSKQPFVIKSINKEAKSGEFIINEPAINKDVPTPSPNQQVMINGIYDETKKTVKVEASSEQSFLPIHHGVSLPQTEGILLKIEMISEGNITYQTDLPLFSENDQTPIQFRINLPYQKVFTLKIYDRDKKLLLSEQINL